MKYRFTRLITFVGISLSTISNILAQTSPNPISISGNAHLYSLYNFNSPLGNKNDYRLYDNLDKQFGFSLIQFSLVYEDESTRGVLDLNLGPAASLVDGSQFGGSSDIIQNAYFVQKVSDKFSVEVGKFGTHIGYEVIDPTVNANYSTSYLFNYGPLYHLGARFRYQLDETYNLMGAIYNNWDNLADNNNAKTLGASFGFAPFKAFVGSLNWIGGYEGSSKAYRSLFDVALTFQASEKFGIGFNGVYGTEQESWTGVASYFTLGFSDSFSSTLRLEYFDDSKGARGYGTSVSEITLSGNYTLKGGKIVIRPEIKADFSDSKKFTDKLGLISKSSQTTIGLALLYSF